MKAKLKKNGIFLGVSIVAAIIMTLLVTGFSWSFKTFSDVLSYAGFLVFAIGAVTAANMSNWFSGRKSKLNDRYSPEDKAKREIRYGEKILDGWMTIGTAGMIILLSMLAVRL
jgi:hypothetical protein